MVIAGSMANNKGARGEGRPWTVEAVRTHTTSPAGMKAKGMTRKMTYVWQGSELSATDNRVIYGYVGSAGF